MVLFRDLSRIGHKQELNTFRLRLSDNPLIRGQSGSGSLADYSDFFNSQPAQRTGAFKCNIITAYNSSSFPVIIFFTHGQIV